MSRNTTCISGAGIPGKMKRLPFMKNWLLKAPETVRFKLGLLNCYQTLGRTADARVLMDRLRKEGAELAQLDLIEAAILQENKPRKSMDLLQKAESNARHLPYFHIQLGNSYQLLQKWSDAERAFLKTLLLTPTMLICTLLRPVC